MLVVAGQNPAGNIVHLLAGPETELFMDIHGSSIVDITDILAELDHDKSVFISLTRTKSEPTTANMMRTSGIIHKNSFALNKPGSESEGKDKEEVSAVKTGKCQFCDRETELVSVPKYSVCPVCVQIELGRALGKQPGPDVEE